MKLLANTYSPTFNSRSAVIRKADNIARLSNRLFPSVSSSRTKMRAKGIEKFKDLHKNISKIIGENVRCHSKQPDALARVMLICSAMKKFKAGNCMEISRITNLICKVNGIDTIPFQFNVIKNGQAREIDHMALLYPLKNLPKEKQNFSNSKNFIIIDPWLGFADYAPKAQERYNKDFKKLLDIGAEEKLVINPNYISHTDKLLNVDVILLERLFPAWIKLFTLPKSLQK